MKTERQIEDFIDRAARQEESNHGSKWPGMSYEQGVQDALRWVVGDNDEAEEEFDA